MIVVDASAALAGLLNEGQARKVLAGDRVWAPDVIDVEVVNGLRRCLTGGHLDAKTAQAAVSTWRNLGVRRVSELGLLSRVWELREVLDAGAASYVALAEALDCTVVTADPALETAAGIQCPVMVVAN
ncbi:type II toxin-antitoxin system VapC family toxin [Mycobacterium timonense]|uniref:Type II toxin-antitoxin system VapC family toxin n=2 Tax=Mycobacterium TaxID=1763 RepID=A0AAW5S871_MYCBC|nr:type II toxin-antitoxin system VapC family toxin [Mycobacterium bouchedurhonense]MCV6998335.1 type II toxin-antitoxin system VapC family toxin [Mycobacterium timonense]ORA47427.1 VapC toxin family PIN domain ribonuclease [Mycobacterium bouchedurhonense]CQD02045.1 toxin [Mycobacterium europaeum]